MLPKLTDIEARVIGCLMEKSVVTPDQYPLTLNALMNACNQKSARVPVMSLKQNEVQRTARSLRDKSLVMIDENFKTGVEKYRQRLCNTTFNDLQFGTAQFSIICLLLLRGPQTPGELRAHSGRLHTFADNDAVVNALADLVDSQRDPLAVKLPRTPGRKDAEYMHQFCGEVDMELYLQQAIAETVTGSSGRSRVDELQQRVRELEDEVVELKARLAVREQ